eukprot:TRINITY_DN4127_c0_g2_i1.p1 TRINITY_DN4127_c0_g2~~TRINITY_DN4127_c0_g2_i1.p1  ORF type:complete len:433 (+),score=117.16 TRINITY_DN4127_c0_g2_i1:57-1355(+)
MSQNRKRHGASGVLSQGFPSRLDQAWHRPPGASDPSEALFSALDSKMFGFLRLSDFGSLDQALAQCGRRSVAAILDPIQGQEQRIFLPAFQRLLQTLLMGIFDELDVGREEYLNARQLEQVCHKMGRSYVSTIGDAERRQGGVQRVQWVDFVCQTIVTHEEGDLTPIANVDTLARLVHLGEEYAQMHRAPPPTESDLCTAGKLSQAQQIAQDQLKEIAELKRMLADHQQAQAAAGQPAASSSLTSPAQLSPASRCSPPASSAPSSPTEERPSPLSVASASHAHHTSPSADPQSAVSQCHDHSQCHDSSQPATTSQYGTHPTSPDSASRSSDPPDPEQQEQDRWEILNARAIEKAKRVISSRYMLDQQLASSLKSPPLSISPKHHSPLAVQQLDSTPAPPPPDLSLIHISEPTRLLSISYAVFCLKKKKKIKN